MQLPHLHRSHRPRPWSRHRGDPAHRRARPGAMGLHRITLEVYTFNPPARHVYEKVGFVHEGTGREALRFDDGWIDIHRMSILASDPR